MVSDDQTQFKAHKIILSACSPVFKNIIDNNPSQHPFIYLRGIQSHELESILQFMYLGEGEVFQNRIREFIRVAKDLQVKDISKGEVKLGKIDVEIAENATENNEEKTGDLDQEKMGDFIRDAKDLEEKRISHGMEIKNEEEETLDYEIISENDIEETLIEEQTKETKMRLQRRSQTSSDNKSSQCSECQAVFKRGSEMLRHYRSKHEGVKYPCNQCNYHATQKIHLQSHIAAKHSDNILQCDLCDYQTKWRSNYKTHLKTHE